MEIIKSNAALLSNYEVLNVLKSLKLKDEKYKGMTQNLKYLATISYEYLERLPCQHQSPEIIEKFLKELNKYNLTKAEKLQLLNLKPQTPVEIQLLIEESEERLTDSQVETLLQTINDYLPD